MDREVPAVVSCSKEGDELYLYLSDAGSGVDFSRIEALDLDGKLIEPTTVDTESGLVVLPAVSSTINIYVADLAGNKLQLVLTIG